MMEGRVMSNDEILSRQMRKTVKKMNKHLRKFVKWTKKLDEQTSVLARSLSGEGTVSVTKIGSFKPMCVCPHCNVSSPIVSITQDACSSSAQCTHCGGHIPIVDLMNMEDA